MTTAEQILDIARQELGTREAPNGSNPYGRAYGVDRVAWCAQFTWWCFRQAGAGHLTHPKTAYTPTLYDWYRSRGRASNSPRVGDLVFFDWPDSTRRIQHVGLVEAIEPSAIVTIEGNTSTANQSDGGGVMRRRRARNSSIVGYGHPAYSGSTSPGGTVGDRILKLTDPWMRGDDVRAAQAGLGIAADGIFGPDTDQAVRAFQAERGLTVDGEVGPQTWAALRASQTPKSAPTPRPAPAPAAGGDLTERRIAAILTELTGTDQPGTFPGFATWGGGTDETLTAMAYHQRTNVEVRQAWLAVQRADAGLRAEVAALSKQVGELVAQVRILGGEALGAPAAPADAQAIAAAVLAELSKRTAS